MNPLFPFKMLVGTGPAYQDAGCFEVATIEVNMIPPGSVSLQGFATEY